MERILHTPEGVRDTYGLECAQKTALRNRMQEIIRRYGYEEIETPVFEYFEVFGKDVGTISPRELYKFFDNEGNTLVLRPDFTPSVARAAATYFREEKGPVRLCYTGNTFMNNSSHQGRLREVLQMGVEYIGDDCADSDAELLAMTVDLLLQAGLTEFQISIGHADYFQSLLEEAKMGEETEEQLRNLMCNKNYFGAEELILEQNLDSVLTRAFLKLPQLFGSREILEEAKEAACTLRAKKAVERLEEIYEVVKCYGYEKYISFDFGMLSPYQYYTGIIFQAYTYGTGEPVVKGGRYNNLLRHFGISRPAVGFAMVMEVLMNALSRQKIELPQKEPVYVISYGEKISRKDAIKEAQEIRKTGKAAVVKREKEGERQ